MNRLPDLSISGMGKTGGGKFANVEISGMGTILGDVDAERISISGKGTIEGNASVARKVEVSGMGTIRGSVTGGQVISSGTASIEGTVEAELVESSGNLKIGRDAKIHELSNAGRCRIEASLKAEKVSSYGLLSVGADAEAEEFYSQGSFSIGGLLNANKIDIEIHGYCQAKEIGGEEIWVRNGHSFSFLAKLISPFLSNGKEFDKLTADLIEGTIVSLEFTSAKVVRGNKITIGPDCVVQEVEYTDELEIDSRAVVHKQTKI